MGRQDLSTFLNKHCHFRFRGGRQAYGVIWEDDGNLVFSSKEYHLRIQQNKLEPKESDLLFIDSDDIMMAEVIA